MIEGVNSAPAGSFGLTPRKLRILAVKSNDGGCA